MPLPNGNMPLSSLQLIMQLAQNNPQVAAQMMASTGAQPPAVPPAGPGPALGGQNSPRGVGTPMAPGPADLMNVAPPAATGGLPAPTQPQANGLAQALAGAVPPTVGPSDQPPPAPGAPGLPNPGGMPDISKLMQTLMQMQTRPTGQMSLGQAIGR